MNSLSETFVDIILADRSRISAVIVMGSQGYCHSGSELKTIIIIFFPFDSYFRNILHQNSLSGY